VAPRKLVEVGGLVAMLAVDTERVPEPTRVGGTGVKPSHIYQSVELWCVILHW
jgi:hypothetical protein